MRGKGSGLGACNAYFGDLRDGLRYTMLSACVVQSSIASRQVQVRALAGSLSLMTRRASTADGAQLSQAIRTLEAELHDPDLSIHVFLGRGAWGMVYGGSWRGLPVAVKMLVVPGLPAEVATRGLGGDGIGGGGGGQRGAKDLRARQRAVLEVSISMSMAHPNVVATYTYELKPLVHNPQGANPVEDDSVSTADAYKLYIVQELCNGDSLGSALAVGMAGSVLAGGAHRRLALRLAADVALGMAHVHSCRIVHGDLKPDNVLLVSGPRRKPAQGGEDMECGNGPSTGLGSGGGSGSGPAGSGNSSASASLQLTAKVADFGLSLPLEAGATHASRRFHGTPLYSAPEVLLEGRQSPHADVWSFGLMLLELFYGCTLSYMRKLHGMLMADAQRGGTGAAGVVGAAAAPKLEDILTKELLNSPYQSYGDLTASCLRVDPRSRPSFEELAKHLLEMLELEDKNAADEEEVEAR
ncbi:putative serine/threonine-protein kinase [Tetrabaena socialis]|uniref:Putative serine/threonine-protein kinase n=1 Tax=Tetrabaena socialis TaxID=47790 RepID=A0A2J7ZXZ4_9CHLO|nr:putative serine/threonine-protein kinase [Tetrabaena socialis]|eukprot:PNH05143.1 putative serine/threonine-protein kinase [Tetrabaena socialis]